MSASPAAHSHTHTASTHVLHHRTCDIVETSVVGIVSVKDHTYLTLVCETSHHRSSLETRVAHI